MDDEIDFAAVRSALGGITQTELALRLKVAQGDISNWEAKKHKPSKLARRALAEAIARLLDDHRERAA
jgi:DNA-binding transcriptional regulator YiaG